MATKQILIIRHPDRAKDEQGNSLDTLSETGHMQAKKAAERLIELFGKMSVIYHSPANRTTQFASTIADVAWKFGYQPQLIPCDLLGIAHLGLPAGPDPSEYWKVIQPTSITVGQVKQDLGTPLGVFITAQIHMLLTILAKNGGTDHPIICVGHGQLSEMAAPSKFPILGLCDGVYYTIEVSELSCWAHSVITGADHIKLLE